MADENQISKEDMSKVLAKIDEYLLRIKAQSSIIDLRRPDYFNLRNDERVKSGAKSAVDLYGTGNHLVPAFEDNPLYIRLQKGLENVFNQDNLDNKKVVLFKSMESAGESVLRLIPREAYVLWEKECHVEILRRPISILKNKYKIRFDRGNVEQFENILEKIPQNAQVWAIFTGLGPSGTVTDLRHLLDVKKRRKAIGIIEDGHGIFALEQKGAIEYSGAQTKDIEFIIGANDKALASNGSFLAYPSTLENQVIPRLNMLKYLTGLSYSDVGAADAALSIIKAEGKNLRDMVRRTKSEICDGIKDMFQVTGVPESPLIKIIQDDECGTRMIYSHLLNQGILTYPYIRESIINPKEYGIRLAIHPLTETEIARVINALKDYNALTDFQKGIIYSSKSPVIISHDSTKKRIIDREPAEAVERDELSMEESLSSLMSTINDFSIAKDLLKAQYPDPQLSQMVDFFDKLPRKLQQPLINTLPLSKLPPVTDKPVNKELVDANEKSKAEE